MDILEFNKLQLVQLEIMDEVHRICSECNIIYYIIGGTALGARRHGGFIPWDVDIDIAMPRKEYEKFAKVCNERLSDRFVYRNYKNTKGFTHPHALVCMKNTYLSSKFNKFNTNEENLGIYLDIFPLDIAPEEKKLQQKQAIKLWKIRRLKSFKHGYRYNNDRKKAFIKKTVSTFIFWTTLDKLNADFDKACREYDNVISKYVCSMASHYKYEKQCMPIEVYGTPKLIKFEDRMYYAPELLDEYLTRIYGDYMKLPPKSEQKANLEIFDKVVFDTNKVD